MSITIKEVSISATAGKKKNAKKTILLNRRRLLNVVFSDVVRPKLYYLGGALSWAEMDAGKKTDQKVRWNFCAGKPQEPD